MVPGLKFSTITSARSASLSAISRAFGSLRFKVMPFFPRFRVMKKPLYPFFMGVMERMTSPVFDGSILMTSAPASTRYCVAVGPEITLVKSRTFIPSRTPLIRRLLCM